VRLSVVLLIAAGAGVLFGGWLIARWALGVAVIFDSLCLGVFALQRDDGTGPVVREALETLEGVLERARAS